MARLFWQSLIRSIRVYLRRRSLEQVPSISTSTISTCNLAEINTFAPNSQSVIECVNLDGSKSSVKFHSRNDGEVNHGQIDEIHN